MVNTEHGPLEHLANYYTFAKNHILRYQNVISGLFPSSLEPNTDVACVRESLYCAFALFSLGRAYGRVGYDGGRRYELTGSAVKCMRGILEAWLKQADKVEKFKTNQSDENALHSKFDLITGLPLKTSSHNVQIDVVALYLVLLVEMTSSGYKIISSPHEVSFIQNLVYYIERAYRTPDWGMWECGSRFHNGTTELNASATGLAKAALESINGFNLYGDSGASWSVIYVDADAHQRNRTIFETILPKQSNSKDTDAALLPVVLWPAYACNDSVLRETTVNRLLETLSGKYGIKRFQRDGFGVNLEESSRSPNAAEGSRQAESKKYAGIESEWPMFYLYVVIDRVMRGQQKEAKHLFATKIEPFLAHSGLQPAWCGLGPRLPAYYFVSPPEIDSERAQPGTAHKLPSQHAFTSQMPCLWAQSLLLISQLLLDSFLEPDDIDPIGRRAGHTGDYSLRYSSFQLRPAEPVVQIIVIAESLRLQQFLATYGIVSQTPRELEPVRIWSPSELIRAYENLGTCERLGLSGRPVRPIGTLGCAKTYSVCGTTVLCYVIRFNVADFYLFHDTEYVIDEVRTDLQFLSTCWRMAGRPTYCLLLREDNFKSGSAPLIFNLLAEMRQGQCSGVHVQLVRLQVAMSQACVEHLDFIDDQQMATFKSLQDREISMEDANRSSSLFADLSGAMHYTPSPATRLDLIAGDVVEGSTGAPNSKRPYAMFGEAELIRLYSFTESLTTKAHILYEVVKRYGMNTEVLVSGNSAHKLLEQLYEESGAKRHWLVVRLCAAMLHKAVDSVAPEITMALVRGKRVSLGVFGKEEHIIEQPLTPAVLHRIIYDLISPYNIAEAVLQQELIILVGRFITLNPKLFEGILTIRIGWIVQAMELQLARDQPNASLWSLSPANVKELFGKVLTIRHVVAPRNVNLHARQSAHGSHDVGSGMANSPHLDSRIKFQVDPYDVSAADQARSAHDATRAVDGDLVGQLRMITGALNRVPVYFYRRVWDVLERASHGIRIGGSLLPQQPTLSDMTQGDANFAFTIEHLLSRVPNPARRQLIVETLMVIWTVLHRNPELRPSGTEPIDVDAILMQAVEDFAAANGLQMHPSGNVNNNEETEAVWQKFYRLDPGGARGTCSLLARALVAKLFSAGFALPPADLCAVS